MSKSNELPRAFWYGKGLLVCNPFPFFSPFSRSFLSILLRLLQCLKETAARNTASFYAPTPFFLVCMRMI